MRLKVLSLFQLIMSLFQFGFLWKKGKENEREKGREGEENRLTESGGNLYWETVNEVGRQASERVSKHVGDWLSVAQF